jgi:hypothetical protein
MLRSDTYRVRARAAATDPGGTRHQRDQPGHASPSAPSESRNRLNGHLRSFPLSSIHTRATWMNQRLHDLSGEQDCEIMKLGHVLVGIPAR